MSRFVGTAGWAIPRRWSALAPAEGKGLSRYSRVLNAAEINSSLYRPHARDTYARWAAGVPENFRFSVKVPKAITHEAKLLDPGPALQQFLDQADGLGPKLGVLLVQLPGRFGFDARVAEACFLKLRKMHTGMVVCEPRNPTWFSSEANAVLDTHGIGRVAADPPRGTTPVAPGGWDGIAYFRLHGSPRIYSSAYDQPFLWAIARRVTALPVPTWGDFRQHGFGLRLRERDAHARSAGNSCHARTRVSWKKRQPPDHFRHCESHPDRETKSCSGPLWHRGSRLTRRATGDLAVSRPPQLWRGTWKFVKGSSSASSTTAIVGARPARSRLAVGCSRT